MAKMYKGGNISPPKLKTTPNLPTRMTKPPSQKPNTLLYKPEEGQTQARVENLPLAGNKPIGELMTPFKQDNTQKNTAVSSPVVTNFAKAIEEKTSSTAEMPSKLELQNRLSEGLAQRQRVQLGDKLKSDTASLEAERQQIDPMFRQGVGMVRTEDAMAREAARKRVETGATGQGSLAQTDIAQNIATQGAITQLREQKTQLEADINRRLQQAQAEYASGIRNVANEQEIRNLTLELAQIEEQEAKQLQQEQEAKQSFLSTIGRFSQDYQAEINRIANDGDPSNDWQIPYLQSARQQKIAGMEERDFQTELANIGQYSQDFQAEINRREAINPNDPLLPYLRSARQQKIAGIEAGQAAQEALRDERLFELAKIQDEREYEVAKLTLENDLKQENLILEGQIREAKDSNDFVRELQLQDRKAYNDQVLQQLEGQQRLDQIALSGQFDLNEIVLRDELSNVTQATEGGLPLNTIEESILNAVGRMPNAEIAQLQQDYLTEKSSSKASQIAERIKFLTSQGPDEATRKLRVMDTIYKNDSWFEGVGGDQKLKSVLATNGITLEEMTEYIQSQENNLFGGF